MLTTREENLCDDTIGLLELRIVSVVRDEAHPSLYAAAAAVEHLDGDPLWLLIVGGSGNAKTETVQALAHSRGVVVTSTIASQGALLSGPSKRERVKRATGGLLRRMGERGVLVVKGMTSILDGSQHARSGVGSAA